MNKEKPRKGVMEKGISGKQNYSDNSSHSNNKCIVSEPFFNSSFLVSCSNENIETCFFKGCFRMKNAGFYQMGSVAPSLWEVDDDSHSESPHT